MKPKTILLYINRMFEDLIDSKENNFINKLDN